MSKAGPLVGLVGLAIIGGILLAVWAFDDPSQPRAHPPAVKAQAVPIQTAAESIQTLQASPDPEARAEAAHELGSRARGGKRPTAGFSDVASDPPEGPELTPEALALIVAALSAGLSDSDERVRAACASSISSIGAGAKAALPALVLRLDDQDGATRRHVLSAIGSIGPAENDTTTRLEARLAKAGGMDRIHVAEALRKTGAAPEVYLPTLIECLAQESVAHYAAMELGQLGDPAVPELLKALQDNDVTRRRYATYALGNMAGWNKLTKDRERVAIALVDVLRDEDQKVVWYAAGALGSVHAAPERSIPALIPFLSHQDESLVDRAAEALRDFGKDARPALPALLETLSRRKGRAAPVDHAIHEIGIDLATAQTLSKMKIEAEVWWLLGPMLDYPALAVEFLRLNPRATTDDNRLIEVLRSPDPRYQRVQELLFASEHLPLDVIATLGDPRHLPLLELRMKKASNHDKAQLAACLRACGRPASKVVAISESKPGDFKPASAWPGSDPKRIAPNSEEHGDGRAPLIVTGRIVRSQGALAAVPKFYRVNDSMLLGVRQKEEKPIVFDPKTGRFVFITAVFAAYSGGEGQPEEGPYQTGSSQVLIEAEGCKPLEVRFFDEMPDVEITLTAS